MALDSWLKFFPSAYHALIGDLADDYTCEKCFEKIVKEYEEHLTWFHEIPGEVKDKFAVKSTKFKQLPKTPTVRARATRKTRRQVAVEDIDENAPLEIFPKKLDFDGDDARDQTESEVPSRPKRNCRQKTSTEVDEKPVRSTRQSRKPLIKKNCDMPPVPPAEILEEKVPVPEESHGAWGKEGVKAVVLDLKKTASPVPNNSITNNRSPSVKERANAYENMLKTKLTPNSPFKAKRGLTPNAASPGFTAATISSQAKASPSITSEKSRPSKTRASLRSSHRRSSRRSSTLRSKKKAPAKPLRSKLRLNKQKAKTNDEEEQNGDADEHEEVDKAASTEQEQCEMETVPAEVLKFAETQKAEDENEDATAPAGDNMNETQVVVTEVFELFNDGKRAELKELEVVKTKTTSMDTERVLPATKTASTVPILHRCSSDQGFAEGDQDASSESSESNTNLNGTFTKAQPTETQGRSTRTRTKKVHDSANVASSTTCVPVERQKAQETADSPEKFMKSTRTRTRVMKAMDDTEKETMEVECVRTTRTRQRKAEEAQESGIRDVKVVRPAAPTQENLPSEAAPFRSTRSKMRKVDPHSVADGKDDEVITGSPAIKSPTVMRLQKKRLVEERGNSPRPKRSCVDEASHLESIPMSTSSPVQQREIDKTVDSMNNSILSPVRQKNRPYLFNSAQKKINGFLNRTPGFANNTKVLTFFGSAPSHRNNGTLTSYLKRNTPPPKATFKDLQEQKKQRLMEKESKDNERIQRAAEARRQKIKEQKRCRDERLKKVAEQREMKERRERELKEQIKRKHEDKAASKEKLLEEKLKAENEKQKLRLRKQMEADARRRHEEEERIRKLQEQEEDTRRQEELMQRKREYEELERKRQMAEEKRRYDEKIAEKEQKKLEELAVKKKREEEREREAERMKREREKQLAQERAERERMEREKREERERKIKEAEEKERLRVEQEMLKEKQRLKDLEEARRNQAKLHEMQKLISQHNQQLKSSANLNTTQTVNKAINLNTSTTNSNSYQITPAVKKLYKPSQNPDDYGVDEKESDDSTDDESEPKKRIPDWATWSRLDLALIKQDANPPDVEAIFCTKYLKPLDLHSVFPRSKGRHKFNQRTSSAFWSSPPVKSRPRF